MKKKIVSFLRFYNNEIIVSKYMAWKKKQNLKEHLESLIRHVMQR